MLARSGRPAGQSSSPGRTSAPRSMHEEALESNACLRRKNCHLLCNVRRASDENLDHQESKGTLQSKLRRVLKRSEGTMHRLNQAVMAQEASDRQYWEIAAAADRRIGELEMDLQYVQHQLA
eukprot:TRINITY_DN82098_c0_g1_i1.p1 TRINITY_DN82098_c0_g1~~TRINITY_DN82098_c0_g1_i1.p1  ORF type:complete len:122 (+),score=23.78 TRINITY_DN82098_c0_g1_i1:37-402(+)